MPIRTWALTIVLLCAGAAMAQEEPTARERQLNIDSFEQVWKTVRDTHWEARPGGLDWNAVHQELRPRIDAAGSTDEARSIMAAMLARLKQTHFGVVPSRVYEELDAAGGREGNPGIDARILEGRAVVTAVDAGSPAAAGGVKPGWQILRVDGRDVEPGLKRLQMSFGESTLLDLMQSRSVVSRLSGATGKAVNVDFLDGADQSITLELDRVKPRGTMAKFGFMPPMYFWVEARKVRPDIGYVRFNMFFEPEPLADAFARMVKDCRDCNGLVIDLRGNPGGLGVLAMGVAGWFTDKPDQRLGTMYMRGNSLKFVIFPRPEPFLGPLAVLVDGCSASTSEVFAGGLKDLKRVRVFGTRTAGAALPSMFEMLPYGDGFQYAVANYISEGGKPLEGIGVIPDEEVKLTRRQLLDGLDPVLEAAVSWIGKQKH
jgi:carboxyl-terminal processing protease